SGATERPPSCRGPPRPDDDGRDALRPSGLDQKVDDGSRHRSQLDPRPLRRVTGDEVAVGHYMESLDLGAEHPAELERGREHRPRGEAVVEGCDDAGHVNTTSQKWSRARGASAGGASSSTPPR